MTKRRNHFTLVELLIAVGLLSLIMMLLLQLFSGVQKLWIASEKTNNVYADARVAMELMADIINTVQFSHGETTDKSGNVVRDESKDMIFSLDTKSTDSTDNMESSSITFVSKTARDLPMKDNTTRFISFRRGGSDDDKTRGKLYMLIYADKSESDSKTFYGYFPNYKKQGNRTAALNSLNKDKLKPLIGKSSSGNGENEFCQVIAENVVEFKLAAYTLGNNGVLDRKNDAKDIAEPPYMIEIQLTVLDRDSFRRWQELSGKAKTEYLDQHKRTFTRNVFIGDRWALEAQSASGNGN